MPRQKSQTPTPEQRRAIVQLAKWELASRGVLTWLLHKGQLVIAQAISASPRGTFVLEIARRFGKTFLLMALSFECCLRKPKARVVYGAPTLKHLEEFVIPAIEKISAQLPPWLRPRWNAAKGHLLFPNGSYVHLFGADDKRKADRGRGPEADLAIFDEAGFCPLLRYVLRSVLRPQLLHTGGRIILGSTPAEEVDHDFTAMAERAEALGLYAHATIHDNPRLTKEQVRQFIEDDAKDEGLSVEEYMASDDFRREYLAERVINKLLIVVPEWAAKRERLILAVERPEYFNGMSILDFGGNDPHAALFGYWHFERAKWVIEDEILLRNDENTQQLADAVKAKEKELWGTSLYDGTMRAALEAPELKESIPEWMFDVLTEKAPHQPFSRWADNDIQLIRDLYELHGIAFIPTAKDDLQLQVNNFRVMVGAEEVLLHPRCVHTDRHLRSTTWANHRRRDFARKAGEHGDLVATCIYGARNLDRRNPMPVEMRPAQPLRVIAANRNEEQRKAQAFMGTGPLARKLMRRS